jgi:LysM repeat protein
VPLEKAIIAPEGQPAIPVLFNPNQYAVEHSNQIAELGVPGLAAPILQYTRGNVRTLSMELFFDTFERGTDVRAFTDRVYGLLAVAPTTHAPPVCVFSWGPLVFRCVLERVSGSFTLFLSDGTPVRATLNVTFKEHVDVSVQVRAAPTQSADHTKTRTVRRGDTLSSIAAAEYGQPEAWRPIAQANGIANPRRLTPGQTLAIPPLR